MDLQEHANIENPSAPINQDEPVAGEHEEGLDEEEPESSYSRSSQRRDHSSQDDHEGREDGKSESSSFEHSEEAEHEMEELLSEKHTQEDEDQD
jgi:hypothetical protein